MESEQSIAREDRDGSGTAIGFMAMSPVLFAFWYNESQLGPTVMNSGFAEKRNTTTGKPSEPRAHHFVPQCWLAGFTESDEKEGRLWVTDLGRAKQWPTNPANAGHSRDFYRLSDPRLDPLVVENTFSKIETEIAPLLKAIDQELRQPTKDELEVLVWFIAIQWVRVPAFRPRVIMIEESVFRSQLLRDLETPETWAAALKRSRIPTDSPGTEYEAVREFIHSKQYSLEAENEWYVQQAFRAANIIAPMLMDRHWRISFSKTGNYIGSDCPVAMDGPKGEMVGFKSAEIVTYPISRHALLYGTRVPVNPPLVSLMSIAHWNTFAMLTAESQVYSHKPDFCWLDEFGKYQTNWNLFAKEKIEKTFENADRRFDLIARIR
jgi:hypothetical protein